MRALGLHGPKRIPRDSETYFAALDHHDARRNRSAGCELCGCLATSSCLQSCHTQGKSGSGRPLQPSNGGERGPRRRPVRYVRPERGREARRAGAHRRRTRSIEREVPEGERERLRVHERFWRRHVRARRPWYVPSRNVRHTRMMSQTRWGTEHAIAATQATTHAGRCRSSTSSTSRSRWTPRRSAPAGSTERRRA